MSDTLVGVSLILTVLQLRSGCSSSASASQPCIGGGRRTARSSSGSVGDSGGVMFLPGDVPPRTVSTLSNLSLFRLILAMCEFVMLSMGEPEFRRGRRDR